MYHHPDVVEGAVSFIGATISLLNYNTLVEIRDMVFDARMSKILDELTFLFLKNSIQSCSGTINFFVVASHLTPFTL